MVACAGALAPADGDLEGTATPGSDVGPAAEADNPCALTTPEVVATAFGATSAGSRSTQTVLGEPICEFILRGGISPTVIVRHRGSSADWDELLNAHRFPPIGEDRHAYEERSGIGDDAFYYRTSVVVLVGARSGPIQYTVALPLTRIRPPTTGQQLDAALIELARVIAGN